jgi:hypothetical protein
MNPRLHLKRVVARGAVVVLAGVAVVAVAGLFGHRPSGPRLQGALAPAGVSWDGPMAGVSRDLGPSGVSWDVGAPGAQGSF